MRIFTNPFATANVAIYSETKPRQIQVTSAKKSSHKDELFTITVDEKEFARSDSSMTSATDSPTIGSAGPSPSIRRALCVPVSENTRFDSSPRVRKEEMAVLSPRARAQNGRFVEVRRSDATMPQSMPYNNDEQSLASGTTWTTSRTKRSSKSTIQGSSQSQVVEALLDALDNDKMADITLIGRDGAQVRATKFVLACQSPAMQEKLYQDPAVAEVYLGDFGEQSIRALKHFCQTGSLIRSPILQSKGPETIHSLVEVASLATVYKYEALYNDTYAILNQFIEASPSLATIAYDAARSTLPGIENFAVGFIRGRAPGLLIETSALEHLCAESLQKLLTVLMGTDGTCTLVYLHKWIALKGATPENMKFAQKFASEKLCLRSLLKDPMLVPLIRLCDFFPADDIDRILVNGSQTPARRSNATEQQLPLSPAKPRNQFRPAPVQRKPKQIPELKPEPKPEPKPERVSEHIPKSVPESIPEHGPELVPELPPPVIQQVEKSSKKKTSKKVKQSKRDMEGRFYQLSPDGSVIIYSIDDAKFEQIEECFWQC